MGRVLIFADEAGDFNFSNDPKASEYFILTTVTFFDDFTTCQDLNALRHDLAWSGISHPGAFHATTDKQFIRDRVFQTLAPHDFRVDATILHKRKAQPQIRASRQRFYQYAWFYHLKQLARKICVPGDEILAVAASIGDKKAREGFHQGVADVVSQTFGGYAAQTTHWPANVDTGLQVADYCCWAIQRKWERLKDSRSYSLIQSKIKSEYDLFQRGTTVYY